MAKQPLLRGESYLDMPRQMHTSGAASYFTAPEPPEELANWLLRLRLLHRVPINYLVPDPKLLPVESLRLFHIDPSFLDRMVEGALSAAMGGSLDEAAAQDLAFKVHGEVDELLTEASADPWSTWAYDGLEPSSFYQEADVKAQLDAIRQNPRRLTGMLIRSSLVRNFPEAKPYGFVTVTHTPSSSGGGEGAPESRSVPLPVLRRETLGADVLLVIVQGEPEFIQIHQPTSGTEYGVDGDAQNAMNVIWTTGPGHTPQVVSVPPRDSGKSLHTMGWGVISVAGLKSSLSAAGVPSPTSTEVAWALQQDPYHHRFEGAIQGMNDGSQAPTGGGTGGSTGGSTGGTTGGGTVGTTGTSTTAEAHNDAQTLEGETYR